VKGKSSTLRGQCNQGRNLITCRWSRPSDKDSLLVDRVQKAQDVDYKRDSTGDIGAIYIAKPAIHWTVPGFKVGYQDEEGSWYDCDGPRNGPPLNYWRQRSDEGAYKQDMDLVDAVLSMSTNQDDKKTSDKLYSLIKNLESRSGINKIAFSRKILGTWAPMIQSDRCVIRSEPSKIDNNFSSRPSKNDEIMEVPFTIDIFRTKRRRLGPKNHYGVFDLKLEQGEELTIQLHASRSNTLLTGSTYKFSTVVDETNEPKFLGIVNDAPLYYGTITYITDYVLIQRDVDGATTIWIRVDDSYLGVSQEDQDAIMFGTVAK